MIRRKKSTTFAGSEIFPRFGLPQALR